MSESRELNLGDLERALCAFDLHKVRGSSYTVGS